MKLMKKIEEDFDQGHLATHSYDSAKIAKDAANSDKH